MMEKNALIIVDMQNDFLKDGSLAVPEGDAIIPIINKLFEIPFDYKIATQDWHPPSHCSFASTWKKGIEEKIIIDGVEQILWPDHCIQGTRGADFSNKLNMRHIEHVVHKGTDVRVDSYSTFFDNEKLRSTSLEDYLRQRGVQTLFFAGVCIEYCVLYSVLDALDLGFTSIVIADAVQGIDATDVEKAIAKCKGLGAQFMTSGEIEEILSHRKGLFV